MHKHIWEEQENSIVQVHICTGCGKQAVEGGYFDPQLNKYVSIQEDLLWQEAELYTAGDKSCKLGTLDNNNCEVLECTCGYHKGE